MVTRGISRSHSRRLALPKAGRDGHDCLDYARPCARARARAREIIREFSANGTQSLGPEERHRNIALAMAHHVESGDLSLALGHHPVLNTNTSAAVAIGPASDVAGGEDVRHAGGEMLIHRHAVISSLTKNSSSTTRTTGGWAMCLCEAGHVVMESASAEN